MSDSKEMTAVPSSSSEEKDRTAQARSARFTPLRSYVTRTHALTKEAGSEALSRLIPVPRLQS